MENDDKKREQEARGGPSKGTPLPFAGEKRLEHLSSPPQRLKINVSTVGVPYLPYPKQNQSPMNNRQTTRLTPEIRKTHSGMVAAEDEQEQIASECPFKKSIQSHLNRT